MSSIVAVYTVTTVAVATAVISATGDTAAAGAVVALRKLAPITVASVRVIFLVVRMR